MCDGGVGSDAEGGDADIRASKEGECGPSAARCANTKQAVEIIRVVYRMHNGVRYLFDIESVAVPYCPR